MGFIYHIGLRQIVLDDAPVFNGNAIEDTISGIQGHFSSPSFSARELFYPNEQTCGGTSDGVFICEWIGATAQGNSLQLPPGLAEQSESIMTESWSVPYSVELPGTCDILVPNLPPLDDSAHMNRLKYTQELKDYPSAPHLKVFGKKRITMGSLDAEIEVIESQLAEGVFGDEEVELVSLVLDRMKIAQQFSLFVSFRY